MSKNNCQGKTKLNNRCKRKCNGNFCKIHSSQQEGEGIVDTLKTVSLGPWGNIARRLTRKPDNVPNKRMREFLASNYGNQEISNIKIGRTPIYSGIEKITNLLTLGKFDKAKKRLGYDTIYHNYFLVTLKDGTVVKLEKNANIEAKAPTFEDFKNTRNIPLNKTTNIKELISNGSERDKNFWIYDPRNSNCQGFTQDIVNRNNLPVNEENSEFLTKQDSKQLLNPISNILTRGITNTASNIDKLVMGTSVNNKRKYKRKGKGIIESLDDTHRRVLADEYKRKARELFKTDINPFSGSEKDRQALKQIQLAEEYERQGNYILSTIGRPRIQLP